MIITLEILDTIIVILMCLTIHRVDATLRELLSKLLDLVQMNKKRINKIFDEIKGMKKNINDFNRKLDELEGRK